MRQNKIFLNIGLNNNNKTVDKIIYSLNYNGLTVEANMLTNSKYKDKKEPTLIIYSKSGLKLSKVINILENLCSTFNQNCIAMRYNLNELIVFNPYKQTDKIKFNPELFKTI